MLKKRMLVENKLVITLTNIYKLYSLKPYLWRYQPCAFWCGQSAFLGGQTAQSTVPVCNLNLILKKTKTDAAHIAIDNIVVQYFLHHTIPLMYLKFIISIQVF